MVIARLVYLVLGLLAIGLFVAFAITGQTRYRVWGVRVVCAAVFGGVLFFVGLLIEHLITSV